MISLFGELLQVFLQALLPILLFAGSGAVADRFLNLDRKTLSQFTVYILLPPLLFGNLMTVQVATQQILRVALFTTLVLLIMAAIGWIYSRLTRLDDHTTSGVVSTATFFNAVNLGFPIALFAFGEEGLRLAGVLVAVNSIPHNVFGLYVAARGTLTRRQALRTLLRMPFLYVMALAAILRLLNWQVPAPLLQPILLLGKAAIPIILICVGMELARIHLGALSWVLLATLLMRLLLAPILAWFIADWVHLDGLLRAIVILQASMPSAMIPIVYARIFGGNVEFLSRAVFYSTLGSLLSLPVLLWLLKKSLT